MSDKLKACADRIFDLCYHRLKHKADFLYVGREYSTMYIYVHIPWWLYEEDAGQLADIISGCGFFPYVTNQPPRGVHETV